MNILQYYSTPRKYTLLLKPKTQSIVIRIHNDCVRKAIPIKCNSYILEKSRELDADGLFDNFEGNLSADSFGFNKLIRKANESGNYIDYSVDLPRIHINTTFACVYCGGSGKTEESYSNKCLRCEGSGKKHVWNWREAYITTFSLNLLFTTLDLCDQTSAKERQHVTLEVLSERDQHQHGSSLGGMFGIEFMDFIRGRDFGTNNNELQTTIKSMRSAYSQMMKGIYSKIQRFGANIRDGYLILDCPGDACGIHTSEHGTQIGTGARFSCHNVDTPAQALTLITGIANLVDYVDQRLQVSAP